MIAASLEITRSGIVFAAAHVFNSLDDHHETKSSRQFLPTENPEGPFVKGDFKAPAPKDILMTGNNPKNRSI